MAFLTQVEGPRFLFRMSVPLLSLVVSEDPWTLTPSTVMRTFLVLAALGLLLRTLWKRQTTQYEFLPFAGILAALWWTLAGRGNPECEGKFIAISLAAFSIGTVGGFVFSSSTGESESIGKVREWMIGGIAALSIAQVAAGGKTIKTLLSLFVPKGCPDDLAVVAGMAVVFSVGGFFLMFFNRELILNTLLAKSRAAARREFEESGQAAGKRLLEAVAQLPGSDEWETTAQQEPLNKDPKVQNYLKQVEAALQKGDDVPLVDIKRAAVAYSLGGQNIHAVQFLKVAVRRNPEDLDLVMMLAKALAELGERRQAINVLLEFKERVAKPSKVDKLLGFYLLWERDKLVDSVKHTSDYLQTAPNDDGAIFNLACAYAQLFGQTNDDDNRKLALENLKKTIAINKVWKERALELTGVDGDFVPLAKDPEFLNLTKP